MPRALDHLVIASHDLAAAASLYQRLGFSVGARNQHPWGTQNHIVQLHGAFLELIALGPDFIPPAPANPVVPFAGFLGQYLSGHEGLAMLALHAKDAGGDAAAFAKAGIGTGTPFHFARSGMRPDGSTAQLAFTLAFAQTRLAQEVGFFVSQQHNPENFWNAASQQHPNTATVLHSVVMVAENPSDHAEFLSHFSGQREMLSSSMGIEIDTGGGRIEVLTPLAFAFRYGLTPLQQSPHLAALRIGVRDMPTALACLASANVPLHHQHGLAIVPPTAAQGVAIGFEADQS